MTFEELKEIIAAASADQSRLHKDMKAAKAKVTKLEEAIEQTDSKLKAAWNDLIKLSGYPVSNPWDY